MAKMKSSFFVTLVILSPLVLIAGIILMSIGEEWGIAVLVTGALGLASSVVLYVVRRRHVPPGLKR